MIQRRPLNNEDDAPIAAFDAAILQPERPLKTRWETPDHLVIEGETLVPDDALRAMPVYEAYLAPNDLRWLRALWVHPDAARAMPYGVLLWRGVDQTSFDDSVPDTLDTVARAISAFEKVSVANALSRAAGLAASGCAAMLLDGEGRLIMANAGAESMLQCGLVQAPNGGRVALSSEVADRWLASLLALDSAELSMSAEAARCRDRLPGLGACTLELSAMRPIGAAPALLGWRFALSVRADAPARAGAVRRTAQHIYRWTNAEFDAVARLAAGEALPEIARQRRSAIETVRSHLKNAKRKAGVRRQVDLVRIFTSLEGEAPSLDDATPHDRPDPL